MIVRKQKAMSLGVVDHPAGEYQGRKYEAYTHMGHVVEGEQTSRKFTFDYGKNDLNTELRKCCSAWGQWFEFDADIDANGRASIIAVSPLADMDEEVSFDV